ATSRRDEATPARRGPYRLPRRAAATLPVAAWRRKAADRRNRAATRDPRLRAWREPPARARSPPAASLPASPPGCRSSGRDPPPALPFLHPHRGVEQARELCRQCGQLVEMGGEQGAAAVGFVQMLDGGPSDGEAVEGRGAAADLIQNDERALAGLIEDGRG